MMPDNCQATFLGSSGNIFGISHLFLGYKKKPKQGNEGCFRVLKWFLYSPMSICSIKVNVVIILTIPLRLFYFSDILTFLTHGDSLCKLGEEVREKYYMRPCKNLCIFSGRV